MHILIDFRPALRTRSGVGEYVHEVARGLRAVSPGDRLTLFTSSLRDRPARDLARDIPGAVISDHRVPVRVLNFAWHRLEWPPVDWWVPTADIVFSPHPLLLPSRRAAQVVMVHDLDFLTHPERTHREIRRDYPALAAPHAMRAERVIVPSPYTAGEVTRVLGVPPERIAICPPGIPEWASPVRGFARDGYLLFFGTQEPRKNVAGLLRGYERLCATRPNAPKLVIAGKGAESAGSTQAPSPGGRIEYRGYVAANERQRLYAGARALVMPSFEEGFGMPALEAMSLGIPVVVSARGALPDLVQDAGLLVDPTDEASIVDAMDRVSADDTLAGTLAANGQRRAQAFSWTRTAALVRQAFADALAAKAAISKSAARSRTDPRTGPETATTRSAASRGDGGNEGSPGR